MLSRWYSPKRSSQISCPVLDRPAAQDCKQLKRISWSNFRGARSDFEFIAKPRNKEAIRNALRSHTEELSLVS